MPDLPPKLDITKELAKGLEVHTGLRQEVLVTTADKLRLCLIRHQELLQGRTDWIGPLGVFLAILSVLVAADFKDALFLSKAGWQIVFTLCLGGSAFWLGNASLRAAKALRHSMPKGMEGTIEDIVGELKVKTPEVASMIAGSAQEAIPSEPKPEAKAP